MTTVEPVRFRIDEYDRMTDMGLFEGRRVELLEGTLYEMPPMRTPHLLALVRLQQMLAPLNAERRLLVQIPVQVPDFDEPEPDLAVLREPLGRHRPRAADLLLAIEVSDNTLDFDRGRKVPAYRRGGVPEVWVINLPERQLEITDELGRRVYQPGRGLAVAVEGVEVDLDALFADLESDER
jgi:Uma2 family endonuclease